MNPLCQLVNKQMSHSYCIVTMRHIVNAYGQGLIYISAKDMRLDTYGYMDIEKTQLTV